MAEANNAVNPAEQPEQTAHETHAQGLPTALAITTQAGVAPPTFADNLKKTHAETAKTLSFWLVGILAGTVVLHYICVMALVLLRRDYAVTVIEDVLHVWLPVLAGLAGSAATYYFTRDSK